MVAVLATGLRVHRLSRRTKGAANVEGPDGASPANLDGDQGDLASEASRGGWRSTLLYRAI